MLDGFIVFAALSWLAILAAICIGVLTADGYSEPNE